jgi:lipid-A-disaccharide synthase
MRILISAAEASSDAHGAELLRALRVEFGPGRGEELRAWGVGGPKLRAQGLDARVDAAALLAMGFTEAVSRLPRLRAALDELTAAVAAERPDVAVLIDYPEFHFRLAERLRAQGVPTVCYIPPKLWAWRRRRARKLRELYRRVLCIFPFEPEFFAGLGVEARYVGNPLLDELPMALTRAEARARLGLKEDERVVTLMPGSRPSELRRHIPLMLEGAARAAARLRAEGELGPAEPLRVLVPLPEVADFERHRSAVEDWCRRGAFRILDVSVSRGDAAAALKAADSALVKSGTSTLEAALLGVPMAVVYRPSWLTARIFRNLIRYRGPVGLVNLAGGWKPGQPYAARELLCEDATPAALGDELVSLLTDAGRRAGMMGEFARLREVLRTEMSPSRAAAREIWEVAGWDPPRAP